MPSATFAAILMIVLHSVSKEISRRQFKRLVLNDINWLIKPRTKVMILGHRASGASVLLEIIAGMTMPTLGWVDRGATVSVPGGLLRYSKQDSVRHLVARLSRVYRVAPREISEFIEYALGRQDIFDVPARLLPTQLRQQLTTALTYAFPCDFYLFGSASIGGGDPKFQAFCEKAYEMRSAQAGIIMTTSSTKAARRFGAEMAGAVIYDGNLSLYEKLGDAIAVFESLPPEELPQEQLREDQYTDEEDDFLYV